MAKKQGRDDLPSTAWAILGLLSFDEELTAYELKQRADTSLRFFYWSPASSAVYSELRRLESRGYVKSKVVPHAEISAKRLYRITEAGRTALAQWVKASEFEPNQLKHYTALRAFYGHLVEPQELSGVARRHEEWALGMLKDLQGVQELVRSSLSPQDPRWRYAELVIEWGLDLYRLEVSASKRLQRRLAGLRRSPAKRTDKAELP